MKKILFGLFSFVCFNVNSQPSTYIGGGLGISSKQALAGEITGGIEFNRIIVQGNIISHIDNVVNNQLAISVKTGWRWVVVDEKDIEITGGIAYNMYSSVLSINKLSPAVSISYVHSVFGQSNRNKYQTGQVYTSLHYIRNTVIASVGLRLHISKY